MPKQQHYDSLVKWMLIAAVKGILELANVKSIDDNWVASGQTALIYNQYMTVLTSKAVQRDDVLNLPTSRSKRVLRLNNMAYRDNEVDHFDQGYIDSGNDYFSNTELNLP